MRVWKVGSFTAAFSLICIGVCMILGLFTEIDSYKLLMVIWPVALILLGIEILLYLIFSAKDSSRMSFSGLSIVIVILIFFASLTFATFNFCKTTFNENKSEFLSKIDIYRNEETITKSFTFDMTNKNKINFTNANGSINYSETNNESAKVDVVIKVLYNGEKPNLDQISEDIIMIGEGVEPSLKILSISKNDDNYKVQTTIKAYLPKRIYDEITKASPINSPKNTTSPSGLTTASPTPATTGIN